MVAYSFKKQFAEPILAGTKRQTVRAHRKRHVRCGEEIQLYTGMRTRYCKLVGVATCKIVLPIKLTLTNPIIGVIVDQPYNPILDSEAFARADGFASWEELVTFWRENHPGVDVFEGVVIQWGDLKA